MNLENHVTSFEISEKLYKLRLYKIIYDEKFWWCKVYDEKEKFEVHPLECDHIKKYPAYLATDLLSLSFPLFKIIVANKKFQILVPEYPTTFQGYKLANVLGELILYLIENDLFAELGK